MPQQLQHADDKQRTAAAHARLTTEADLDDNQPTAAPDPTRPPTSEALHAAQDRLRTEGRRLDNEQARPALGGRPATADRGTDGAAPTGLRP